MAKRKRADRITSPVKKRATGQHAHGPIDPEKYYKVKAIIAETASRYLISWEDDEETGERYDNTWEPKSNVTADTIADWKAEQRRKQRQATSNRSNADFSASSPLQSPGRPSKLKIKPRRVVESSPPVEEPASPSRDSYHQHVQAGATADGSIEISESQPDLPTQDQEVAPPASAGSPLFEPLQNSSDNSTNVAVHPSPPPSSYLAGNYQLVDPSSSQPVTSSGLTNHRATPEPSQYLPETSKFTEDTTEITVAPSTSIDTSGTDLEQGPASVVLGSQTVRGTSSYRPSDTDSSAKPTVTTDIDQPSVGAETNVPAPIREQSVSRLGSGSSPPQEELSELATGIEEIADAEARVNSSVHEQQSANAATATAAATAPLTGSPREANVEGANSNEVTNHADPGVELVTEGNQPTETQPEQPLSNTHIDLTLTQNQTTSSAITVTPPSRRPLRQFGDRGQQARQLHSSNWQSTQFRTQLSEPLHASTQGGVSAESVAPSPLPFSSPLPPAPSQLINLTSVTASAPQTPKSALQTAVRSTSEGVMDRISAVRTLGSGAARGREKMRLFHEENARKREASQASSAPLVLPPSDPSIQPSTETTAAQPAVAPVLASPLLLAHNRGRSPSAVPALEIRPVISKDEMQTSRRFSSLLPQSEENGIEAETTAGPVGDNDVVNGVTSDVRSPQPQQHDVPIYFIGHQRDQYTQTVYYYRDLIQRFLTTNSPDPELKLEAERFVVRMRRITIHPDLDNAETFTQYDVDPSQQATWDVSCSAKFRFLKEFLAQLRESSLHVVILTEPGRLMGIIETFLKGIEVPYYHCDAESDQNADSSDGLRISLVAKNTAPSLSQLAGVVLTMDNGDARAVEIVNPLQGFASARPMLVSLVVPYSVEQIEQSISPALSDGARLRALVSGIHQYRNEAGKAQEGQALPRECATTLAKYLVASDSSLVSDPEENASIRGTWPLPTLAVLEDLDSQTDSEVNDISGVAASSANHTTGEKRLRESLDLSDPEKRARLRSASSEGLGVDSTVNPQDITHISDSLDKTTQSHAENGELTASEQAWHNKWVNAQTRLDEHVRDLGDLQFRYEDLRTKLIEVTAERDNAIGTAQNAVVRLSEESNRMSNIRNENSLLKEQLQEANAKLLDPSIPERAEFETLRLALEQAKIDKTRAEKRLEQAVRDTDYVRELYQNSSNGAQALATQVGELDEQLSATQIKATGEQARLRKVGNDDFTRNLQAENRKLKILLKEREAGLRDRDEEIAKYKLASRGRMGTRGSSVPRSPRGSRQTSPVMGDVRAMSALNPLRNA